MAYFAKRKSRVGAKSRWELFEDGRITAKPQLKSEWSPTTTRLLASIFRRWQDKSEQYGLDGLYPSQLKRVVDSLVARFEKRAAFQLPELFLIVDCEGYTIDVNWDSLAKVGKYECRFLSGGIRNSTQQKARF